MAKKILVVDDEPDIVKLLELRLRANGFEVATAYNGTEALDKVKDVHPDLIILDVLIPAPNGFQVCRKLKDDPKYKEIPVILLTAKTTESDQFWGMESGADKYVTKPYNAEELLQEIKKLI
ncbi:MAG: response regulator [Candidatus Omnitrophica bacterium]|nr:response regulator [Candidatus Omnitrophota bacterium]MDD4900284.1 response regulator [Candidatus Omnitrophota bacterium]MDD5653491.1 response regulator [Candidatus Omnitrophota bacterium]